MKQLLREPLLHFLLLGAALFGIHALVRPTTEALPPRDRIVVTKAQVENMAYAFARIWQRPPSPDELTALVRDRIREEVYCRQAIALGLDQDDTIIRRRLRQKMEFICNDLAAQTEPTDAQLEDYLQANAGLFRRDARFTFRHVYLNPDKRGASAQTDAQRLLAQLRQGDGGINLAALGDRLLLEPQFTDLPADEVGKLFGPAFAARLPGLASGQWHGPVESSYGIHLVFIDRRTEGRLPSLGEVRDAVRQSWETTQREQANEKFYQELLSQYTVTIEELDPDEAAKPSEGKPAP